MQVYELPYIEKISEELLEEKPIRSREIDFNNPYYTQPKSVGGKTDLSSLENKLRGSRIDHLYVHVPYCKAKCFYCNYPREAKMPSLEEQDATLDSLERELDFYENLTDLSGLKTVHIGGGTPNILDHEHFERLLELCVRRRKPQDEYAVELYPSPSMLDEKKFELLRRYGADRLSIGIQTFDTEINLANNRIEQEEETVKSLIRSAMEKFSNISVDLLYGQKKQFLNDFQADLEKTADMGVHSVYLYQTRELIKKRSGELQQALNLFLTYFASRGYEIVSFDQAIRKRNSSGFCRHRGGRGKNESLLGIGPGSVTEIDHLIFKNKGPGDYQGEASLGNIDPDSIVFKTDDVFRREYFNRSLRHFSRPDVDGLYRPDYLEKFQSDVMDDFGDIVRFLEDKELVKISPDRVEITDVGMLFTQHINYLLLEHYK